MSDKTPLILDTDIGNDIDDAVALAYLLRQPRCELVGVTTVTGDTRQRAAMCRAICEAEGRSDVPIHVGATGPLLTGPGQPHVPQYQAIADRGNPFADAEPTAIEFLRRTIRDRPGEITLLAIGPMTNIALLFKTDPEIPALLKQLVLMCGVFTGVGDERRGRFGGRPGAREWNALVDPIATAITFAARPPVHLSFGLDVTTQCRLDGQTCLDRFAAAGGGLSIVHDFAEIWLDQQNNARITFHDPLAAAGIFEPDLCEYTDMQITVETASETLGGVTSFDAPAKEKPHRIAIDVDAERFFDHYFEITGVGGE